MALDKIIKTPLEEIMGDRFGRYSKYIIQDRALPDVRDGLKPVQRRILYSMLEEGNRSDKPYRKSAKSVGAIMGNYHPHGDSSIYEALARMSQDWKLRNVLIDMHGNKGSIDGDPPAAMRYTESRLAKMAEELLKDIEKDTVDFVFNFDDSAKEPVVLPATFPNLLVNGATGISAGYATNIPPHNLGEVIDASILLLDKPRATLDEIMEIVKGPDFPVGGIIQGVDEIKKAYETGKGKIVVRGRTTIENLKAGKKQIVITEIPYEVNKSTLVKRMDTIRAEKKVDGIVEVRDETDREGIRIVIELRKDAEAETILNYFYKNTDLQVNYNFNMVAIDERSPKLLGLKNILTSFIEHRTEVITRRSKNELERANKRLHIVEGLIKAVSMLDEVVKTIKDSKNKSDAKNNLEKEYEFTPEQSEAIVMLQLYRLSNTDIKDLEKESKDLNKSIKTLGGILSSKTKLKGVIKKELEEVKTNYADERRTEVQKEVEEVKVDMALVIPEEDVVVSVSRDGYVKRSSMRSYNSSGGELEVGLKDGDEIKLISETKTTHILLAFTNKGNYVFLPIHHIEDAKWKDTGRHISTYAQLESGEIIVEAFDIEKIDDELFVTIIKDNGLIKRTLLSEYEVQRFGKSYTAIKNKDDEEVIGVWLTKGGNQIAMITENNFGIHFEEDEVAPKGIRTEGMRGIHLHDDDKVIRAEVLRFKKDVKELEDEIGGKIEKKVRGRRGTKVK